MGNECSCYGNEDRIKDKETVSMNRPLKRQSYVAGHKSMTKANFQDFEKQFNSNAYYSPKSIKETSNTTKSL